jgi:hypothetical protein
LTNGRSKQIVSYGTSINQTYAWRAWITARRRHRFPTRYTRADIELLAQVDEAHETLSGPATRRILEREFRDYGKPEFERLAAISNGHLYNLRRTPRYHQRLQNYRRVDTVHQGDTENAKGVFHLNAVDEITQWEIAAAVPRISEALLEPVSDRSVRLADPQLSHDKRS